MSKPTTQSNDDHALAALIKLYEGQLIMTQDTLDKLKELKDARTALQEASEELHFYREREALRLTQNNPDIQGEIE